ncbi:MAG TPA: NAD(P)-dependent oxidoreductase, partial [Gemmatimonadales bacterium]|nr:NAD(P)-dependent oxidoreductase [Gemmatimonadales bacterium]
PVEPEVLDGLPAEQLPLDTLLGRAEGVTLHVPATPDTNHLVNAERLARMKPGAVLVNTTRGSVVDEPALAEALRSGRLAAAALDVYEAEPEVHPLLLSMENVVLLPHLGSATVETRTAMGLRVVANLDAFFAGKGLPDAVLPGALRHRG